jgi:hypothetical protein
MGQDMTIEQLPQGSTASSDRNAGVAKLVWSWIAAISTLVGAFSGVYFWGLENGKDLGETKIKARVQAERETVERELGDRIQRVETDRDIAQKQRQNALVELDKAKLAIESERKDREIAEETMMAAVRKVSAANSERDRLAAELAALKTANDDLSTKLREAMAQLTQGQPPQGPEGGGGGPGPVPPAPVPVTKKPLASRSFGTLQVDLWSATLSGRTATLVFTLKNTSKQTLNIFAYEPELNFGADGAARGVVTVNGKLVPNTGGVDLEPGIEYGGQIEASDVPVGAGLVRSLEMRMEVAEKDHKLLLNNLKLTNPQ